MTTRELLTKAVDAMEFGMELRAKRVARLSRRTGVKPGTPQMREHIRRTEWRYFQKLIRELQRAN
jgi:hypothetical protein